MIALGLGLYASSTSALCEAAGWNADLETLFEALAQDYANFEDAYKVRQIDLPAIALRTRQALAASVNDDERRKTLDQLVGSFADPHLTLSWTGSMPTAPQEPCAGGALAPLPTGIRFARSTDFKRIDSWAGDTFAAGLLRLDDRQSIGVIRIGSFAPTAFAGVCERLRKRQTGALTDEQVEAEAGRILDGALEEVVAVLAQQGATRLVLDVTDNGGGNDWVEAVVRLLAGEMPSARVALLKHAVSRESLSKTSAALSRARDDALPAQRPAVERALGRVERAAATLGEPCDQRDAWAHRAGRPWPSCTRLVDGALFASGAFDVDPRLPHTSPALFSPSRYEPYPLRITTLPLTVLVDARTHSAAEELAAMMQDNRAALIVGSVTAGAGCGSFGAEGVEVRLTHSGGVIHLPDCVRRRADGTSERRGVVPDVLVPWGPSDSQFERMDKTVRALAALH